MQRLYNYQGTISSFSYEKTANGTPHVDMILGDIEDFGKAPTRIQAYGALAEYINKIEWTDAEERYIKSNWYYDCNLDLRYISIPSTTTIPAKIIASDICANEKLWVFGPEGYIEESDPCPMNKEEFNKWHLWRVSHF